MTPEMRHILLLTFITLCGALFIAKFKPLE